MKVWIFMNLQNSFHIRMILNFNNKTIKNKELTPKAVQSMMTFNFWSPASLFLK